LILTILFNLEVFILDEMLSGNIFRILG